MNTENTTAQDERFLAKTQSEDAPLVWVKPEMKAVSLNEALGAGGNLLDGVPFATQGTS